MRNSFKHLAHNSREPLPALPEHSVSFMKVSKARPQRPSPAAGFLSVFDALRRAKAVHHNLTSAMTCRNVCTMGSSSRHPLTMSNAKSMILLVFSSHADTSCHCLEMRSLHAFLASLGPWFRCVADCSRGVLEKHVRGCWHNLYQSVRPWLDSHDMVHGSFSALAATGLDLCDVDIASHQDLLLFARQLTKCEILQLALLS